MKKEIIIKTKVKKASLLKKQRSKILKLAKYENIKVYTKKYSYFIIPVKDLEEPFIEIVMKGIPGGTGHIRHNIYKKEEYLKEEYKRLTVEEFKNKIEEYEL